MRIFFNLTLLLVFYLDNNSDSSKYEIVGNWKFCGFVQKHVSLFNDKCNSNLNLRITHRINNVYYIIGSSTSCVYIVSKSNIVTRNSIKLKGIDAYVTCNALFLYNNIDKANKWTRNGDSLFIYTKSSLMKFVLVN